MSVDVRPVAAEAAAALRVVLAGVTGASDVVPEPEYVSYLRGAADALAMVGTACTDANTVGRPVRDGAGGT
jgi:hypothetical protein